MGVGLGDRVGQQKFETHAFIFEGVVLIVPNKTVKTVEKDFWHEVVVHDSIVLLGMDTAVVHSAFVSLYKEIVRYSYTDKFE